MQMINKIKYELEKALKEKEELEGVSWVNCDNKSTKKRWYKINERIRILKRLLNNAVPSTKSVPSDVIIERAGNITKHGTEAIRAICGTDEEYTAYVNKYKIDTKSAPILWLRKLACGHSRPTNVSFELENYEKPKVGDMCYCRECCKDSEILIVEECQEENKE